MISAISTRGARRARRATASGHRATRRADDRLRRSRRRTAGRSRALRLCRRLRSALDRGSDAPALPGQGAVADDGGWRPIRAGEFILGYLDEEGVLPAAPPPAELSTNGSFLVYRKLHQDVAAFRTQLADAAKRYPGGEELLAAKLVGRWRDGTPLDLSPERPDPSIVADEQRNNAFCYAQRRRRAALSGGRPCATRQPARQPAVRGKAGQPPPPGPARDSLWRAAAAGLRRTTARDRGVIFMCLQASIARQFEFIQSQWLNGGNAFSTRRGSGRDAGAAGRRRRRTR